ncbi:MAG: hypothetical protein IPL92_18280 [Saprospiraceae bacterium]|nr:hypothetical protein [Candidatus Opimibacter iunctus]
MRYTVRLLLALLMMNVAVLHGQSFEGVVTMNISTSPEKIIMLTIKGDITMMEMQVDSAQHIKLIKDRAAETSTILRSNEEMKYGYRSRTLYGEDQHIPTINAAAHQLEMTVTEEEKYINHFRCVKALLHSPKAQAEAWITKETGLHLSGCFPNFLGEGADPDLYALRELADQEGLIMYYKESLVSGIAETVIEVTAQEKEITLDAFAIDPGYLVLDEEGIKRLYQQAQSDPLKKIQWEEFRQIFGNK